MRKYQHCSSEDVSRSVVAQASQQSSISRQKTGVMVSKELRYYSMAMDLLLQSLISQEVPGNIPSLHLTSEQSLSQQGRMI